MVDYVLTLAIVVSVVTIMAIGFRKSLFTLWQGIAREVSAACPGCPPDSRIRLR